MTNDAPVRVTLPQPLGVYAPKERIAIAMWLHGLAIDIATSPRDTDWQVEEFFVGQAAPTPRR